jgi:hypothetical protein
LFLATGILLFDFELFVGALFQNQGWQLIQAASHRLFATK